MDTTGYTKEDLITVQRAIIALADNKRAVSVEVAGRKVTYAFAKIDELFALEARIIKALRSKGRRRSAFRTRTRSGF